MTNSQPIKEILKDTLKTTQESFKESRTLYESARQKIRELSDELNRFNIRLLEIEREFYDIYSLLLQKNQKLEGWIEAIIKMNDLNSIPEASPADQIPEGEALPEENKGNSYEITPENQTHSAESTTSIANQQDQSLENKEKIENEEKISEKIIQIYPSMKHFYEAIKYIKVIQSNILPKISTKLSSGWITALNDHLKGIYNNVESIESNPIWHNPSNQDEIDDLLNILIRNLKNQLKLHESRYLEPLCKSLLGSESKDELWWTLMASLQNSRDKIYDFLEAIPQSDFRSIIDASLLDSEEYNALCFNDWIDTWPVRSNKPMNSHLHTISRGAKKKEGDKWHLIHKAKIIISGGTDSSFPTFPILPDYVRYKPKKT